jgi:hypothetical protein
MVLALTVLAAPTVGDVGSCGQEVAELDPEKFFSEKDFVDCNRCLECGLMSAACLDACDQEPAQTGFDPDCFPLVHDGEVCLNALRAASCDDYARYMSDVAPTTATECNFCPLSEKPAGQGGP